MPQPFVSVVLPVHNRAALLSRAVDSVVRQTWKNWELLIVDDGSADESAAVAQRYADADPRIRVLKHEINRGANAARNTGVREARGEWIALLDSDDEWLPDRLQGQVEYAISQESLAKRAPRVYYAGYIEAAANGDRTRIKALHRGNVYKALLRGFFGVSSTLLIHRSVFQKIGYFDEQLKSAQEYDFTIRASQHFLFHEVRRPLAILHHHGGERVTTNPQGWDRLLAKHGNAIRRAHGRKVLSTKLAFCGSLYKARKMKQQAAAFYVKAIKECPWNGGAWARLLALAVQ